MQSDQDTDRRIFIIGLGELSAPLREIGDAPGSIDGSPNPQQSMQVHRIADVGAGDLIDQATLRRMDRFSQMSMVAAEKAVRDSRLTVDSTTAERTGIVFNSCFGPLESTEQYVDKILKEGPRKAPAGLFPYTALNVFTGLITMRLKLLGTNSTLCGSSSMTYAVNALRQGTDDTIFVGGVEALTESIVDAFDDQLTSLTALNRTADGTIDQTFPFSLGEAAAVVVLQGEGENGTVPQRALARVHGFGSACSGGRLSPFDISEAAISESMVEAMDSSGISPDQIDLIVFGGNGFGPLQKNELKAARSIFSVERRPTAINPKYRFGETLGAAETLAVSVAATVLDQQRIPESMLVSGANWPSENKSPEIRYALVNSIEFGGAVTSFVLSQAVYVN